MSRIKSKDPRKRWVHGVDMPKLSKESWKDLQDQWPADIRINSDAWKVLSVAQPAWVAMQPFMKELLNGETIDFRSFCMLCWLYRCQEAQGGYGTTAFPAMKPLNIGGTLWYKRKSKINKLGLVESRKGWKVYRVTGLGITLIRKYVDNVEQAHKDIRFWISLQSDEHGKKLVRWLNKNWPTWDD